MKRRSFVALSAGLLSTPWWSPAALAASGTAKWTVAASLPSNIQEIYATVHQGKLIVAGGIAAKLGVPYFTSNVYAFDPGTDSWADLPALPEPLHHVALVSTGADLWAIGGFNGGYTHIWRMRDKVYKLQGDAWEPQTGLPTPQPLAQIFEIQVIRQPGLEVVRRHQRHQIKGFRRLW